MNRKESKRRMSAFEKALTFLPKGWPAAMQKEYGDKYATEYHRLRFYQINKLRVAMSDDEINDLAKLYPAAVSLSGLRGFN